MVFTSRNFSENVRSSVDSYVLPPAIRSANKTNLLLVVVCDSVDSEYFCAELLCYLPD